MAELNTDGNIEVYPGPRGFSVVGAEGDGTNVRFVTDEPRTLNPVALPRGAKGDKGTKGDPGQASIRVDETVGYRVFLWEIAVPSEQLVYGDTGVRAVDGGTVRRVNNTVYTTVTDPTTLPTGFKPDAGGSGTMFFTSDPWPTTLPGTKVTDPTRLKGLEGYDAATANGYPGTAEQWIEDRYRVLQDPAGASLGQVYTRTETGAGWRDLPQIGPGTWHGITLSNWRAAGSGSAALAQSRVNNGTVETYGLVTYTGPAATAGMWSTDSVRVGVLNPAEAPVHNIDVPAICYRGDTGARPEMCRLNITPEGVIRMMSFGWNGQENEIPLRAGITQLNLTGLSWAHRPQ